MAGSLANSPPLGRGIEVVQYDDNVAEPQGHIDTREPQGDGEDLSPEALNEAHQRLLEFASRGGDLCELFGESELTAIGARAVQEYRQDNGSRSTWREIVEEALDDAAQEDIEAKDFPWDGAANVRYPLLTVAAQQFGARAMPAIIQGDQAVGVKLLGPTPQQMAEMAAEQLGRLPRPQTPQAAQQYQQMQQVVGQAEAQAEQHYHEREARAARVKEWLNHLIFYRMDDWEGDTDVMVNQIPIVGIGFKKVYPGPQGTCSEYVNALDLVVAQDCKSLERAPRITHGPFDVYPYEIAQRQRAGTYRDVTLAGEGDESDPEAPRKFIEQHRMEDLDGDGLPEPYVVTCDLDTEQVVRLEAGYRPQDITVDSRLGKVTAIRRWVPFAAFPFLVDPKGRFYAIGFGHLLRSITDVIDSGVNQLLDAGSAEIAGGGFISGGLRLQGSGQGGALYWQPGEYHTVSAPAGNLQQMIWERTVPHPSAVTMNLLQVMLAAGKDIASVKDVITGEANENAQPGTVLALQSQALQVFSSIYGRIWRGLKREFRLIYECEQRYGATPENMAAYKEVTGGDFQQDFLADPTDIVPVSDPKVVTKQQQIAKGQSLLQLASSPIGQAAGMGQPDPAKAIITEILEALDVDNPSRFFGAPPQPNPIQEAGATAKVRQIASQADKAGADATLARARALREVGLASKDTDHDRHKAALLGSGAAPDGDGQLPEPPQAPALGAQAPGAAPMSTAPSAADAG